MSSFETDRKNKKQSANEPEQPWQRRRLTTKMPFTADDKILIKVLRLEKGYGAKRLKSEFPNKDWNLSSMSKLIEKIDETGNTERKSGSGRKRSVSTVNNIEAVEELILSQDDAPGSHLSLREIDRTLQIPKSSVADIVRNDLHLTYFKRKKGTGVNCSKQVNSPHTG